VDCIEELAVNHDAVYFGVLNRILLEALDHVVQILKLVVDEHVPDVRLVLLNHVHELVLSVCIQLLAVRVRNRCSLKRVELAQRHRPFLELDGVELSFIYVSLLQKVLEQQIFSFLVLRLVFQIQFVMSNAVIEFEEFGFVSQNQISHSLG